MTPFEMGNLILAWAQNRTEPFTTADVFNEIDASKDAKEASDGLGYLYRKGLLARKKIDSVRFAYVRPAVAPAGYECIEPSVEKSVLINETPPAVVETEQPDLKVEAKHKETVENLVLQSVEKNDPLSIKAQTGQIEIPESFVVSLRSPSGLIITITSPGAK